MNTSAKRSISPIALLMTGLGSIIGSGWLFGAWRAADIAGPAAIFAWVIGAAIISLIALTYIELATTFPESGGMARYAQYTHGSFVGFIGGWSSWLSIVTVVPIEAVASVNYMASWPFEWAKTLHEGQTLTTNGLILSSVLLICYFAINYWGVKFLVKSNSAITFFKIVVPLLTVVGIMWSGFHVDNFGLDDTDKFAPYGFSAVLTAVATSGIVFAFNGFQSPLNLAGEAKNPSKSIPFAVLGSILFALVLYVLLQIAFIGAIDPATILNGWHGLNFSSPFVQLALAVGLNWLVMLLYVDAVISPSGTGSIYVATTARMIQAMERNNTMPKIFGTVHPLYNVPRAAMWLNFFIAVIFLFYFRGWVELAAVISVAKIISYIVGPISVTVLRKNVPSDGKRFSVPFMGVIAPTAFVCTALLLYWAHWPLTGQIISLMAVGLPIYLYYQAKKSWVGFKEDLRSAWWLICYFPTLALLSFLGSQTFGGIGLLPDGWDFLIIGVIALGFYIWGVKSGNKAHYLKEMHAQE